MASRVQKFSQNVARQQNELARLKIVRGSDAGSTFVLTTDRATIGRGDAADVQIMDIKASRLHAELMRNARKWYVRDLGSANGVFFQGAFTRQCKLVNGAIFAIGDTQFEFLSSVEAKTSLLLAPPRQEIQVVKEIQAKAAHENRIMKLTTVGGLADINSFPGAAGAQKSIRPSQVILAIAIIVLLVMPEGKKEGDKIGKGTDAPVVEAKRGLALEHTPNPTAKKFYREGFREYREGNLLRAIRSFELAKRVDPDFKKAQDFIIRCREEIKVQVSELMKDGIRNQKAGKLRSAAGNFEAVKRLLNEERENENYKEAERRLGEVQKMMREGAV